MQCESFEKMKFWEKCWEKSVEKKVLRKSFEKKVLRKSFEKSFEKMKFWERSSGNVKRRRKENFSKENDLHFEKSYSNYVLKKMFSDSKTQSLEVPKYIIGSSLRKN